MPFLRNHWYVGAFAEEVGHEPLNRRMLDEPIVMYRSEAGEPIALSDVCPHKSAPLHMGVVHGDTLACPYHGLRFDPSGQCVHNPNFDRAIPKAARVRSYPVKERDGLLWIWMGERAKADTVTIPLCDLAQPSVTSRPVKGYIHVKAHYELLTDNLLDQSHGETLHPYLLKEGATSRMQFEVRQERDTVISDGLLPKEPITPILSGLWDRGPIDRADHRFIVTWNAPSYILLTISAYPPGSNSSEGVTGTNAHLLTPETAGSTHYFWIFARDSRLEDDPFDEELTAALNQTFVNEDRPILEWQQTYLSELGDLVKRHPLKADAGGVRARRVVERMLAAERQK
ncbi:vanillate monooxygenase [Sphingobium lactosutens]|uniref:aromatic ring-hydroxylating dioxygenase subunit alpha n=1 Tax=Sphingobium lactosutens TaxID=522773 RepID=UPI0015BBFAD8|nr:aromatic ring-hydroxylating dioxygenase subunit alpha [Sphingobium lactosutens]NWK97445.1 vanillate monooxygenase [Sphingobium lactosutens]